ncbi:Killer cell lectin-like receptor H1 [Apodemus speciosus]|uniref:Killer cell lectin-like receptor H1 n=1 Tax=Apodemus speciosus TaxID=105296 RepID=A0ABQ0EWB5_APOSI
MYSQENHELQKTLNHHDNCSTMHCDIALKKEILRNKCIGCSPCNDLLESFNREQNRWYSEIKTVLYSSQHTISEVEIYWFCYGIKCYYVIKDRKSWNECKQTCQNSSLSLLKIDDEDELHIQEKHELQETLNNLHHNYSTMQNESYLKEEMLTNKSIQCDSYKNLLDTLKRQQNRCHGGNKIVLNCLEHRAKRKFLQLAFTPENYWIGLKYDCEEKEWAWIGDSPSKLCQLSEMNEERPTYAELKLSLKSKKDKKQPTQKKREYPWRLSVVILGTVCLCLLVSSTVLGYLYLLQFTQESHKRLQIWLCGKGCYRCQGGWSCCGEKCYYFSKEEMTWDESEASCRLLGSHLAKIDSREEQNFIQSRLSYSYWVGLRKNGDQFQWLHHKDAKLSSDLDFHMSTHVADAACGYIKPTNLDSAQCSRYFHYICKKNFACKQHQRSTVWREEQKKQELKTHRSLHPQLRTGFSVGKGTDPSLKTWRMITLILAISFIILVIKVGFLIPSSERSAFLILCLENLLLFEMDGWILFKWDGANQSRLWENGMKIQNTL